MVTWSSRVMQGRIPHPLNQELPDLPPAPVLWIATSDGMLRAYHFSHLHAAAALKSGSLLQVRFQGYDARL